MLKAGEEIELRPKVYETLKYLVEHPGRLIGKQELMQAVWPDAFVTDDSLVQCTLELRRALDDRSQQLPNDCASARVFVHCWRVIQRPTKAAPFPLIDLFDLSDGREPSSAKIASAKIAGTKIARKRHVLPTPRTSLI